MRGPTEVEATEMDYDDSELDKDTPQLNRDLFPEIQPQETLAQKRMDFITNWGVIETLIDDGLIKDHGLLQEIAQIKEPDNKKVSHLLLELIPWKKRGGPQKRRAALSSLEEKDKIKELAEGFQGLNIPDETFKPKWIIHSKSHFKTIWDFITLLCLLFTFIYVPIRLSYLFDRVVPMPVTAFEYIVDFVFAADIVLTFFTPVVIQHEAVYDKRTIAKEYLCSWFIIDLITIIPFEIAVEVILPDQDGIPPRSIAKYAITAAKSFRILRLLKLLRAFRLRKQDHNFLKLACKAIFGDSFIINFLTSLSLTLICLHIMACSWYAIAANNEHNNSWIVLNNFSNDLLLDKYVDAVYFCVQTFTTTGYGDIISSTNLERLFRIFIMCAGTLIYSFFTGDFVDYMSKANDQTERAEKLQAAIDRVEKKYTLPEIVSASLKQQVVREKKPKDYEEEFDFSKLDLVNLGEDNQIGLKYVLYSQKLSKIGFFKGVTRNMDLTLKLGEEYVEREYGEGETIYSVDHPSLHFYIILSGHVQFLYTDFDEFPFYKVKKGFFGEFELLSPNKIDRKYTAKAATDCRVIQLSSEMFHQLMAEHPDSEWASRMREQANIRDQAATDYHDKTFDSLKKCMDSCVRDLEKKIKLSGSNPATLTRMDSIRRISSHLDQRHSLRKSISMFSPFITSPFKQEWNHQSEPLGSHRSELNLVNLNEEDIGSTPRRIYDDELVRVIETNRRVEDTADKRNRSPYEEPNSNPLLQPPKAKIEIDLEKLVTTDIHESEPMMSSTNTKKIMLKPRKLPRTNTAGYS